VRSAFQAETARRNDKTLPAGYKPIVDSRDFSAWVVSADGKDILIADAESKK
jgi:hypothetical protein